MINSFTKINKTQNHLLPIYRTLHLISTFLLVSLGRYLCRFILYIYYWNLQFLNIVAHSGIGDVADVDSPV